MSTSNNNYSLTNFHDFLDELENFIEDEYEHNETLKRFGTAAELPFDTSNISNDNPPKLDELILKLWMLEQQLKDYTHKKPKTDTNK